MEDLKEDRPFSTDTPRIYPGQADRRPVRKASVRISILRVLGVAGILMGLFILVHSFLPEDLTVGNLLELLDHLGDRKDAPWLFIGLFLLATQAFISVVVMIIVNALILGVKTGIAVNVGGIIVSALLGYFLGWFIGPKSLKQLLPGWASRHIDWVSGMSPWSVAFARLVPVLPYQAFNLIAGATRLRLRAYLLGTAVGDLPATTLMTWAVGNLHAVNWQEGIPWYTLLLAAGITGLLTLSGYLLSRWLKRYAPP